MEENMLINNKKIKKIPVIPTVFLLIVILFSAVLYFYNYFLEKKNDSLNEEIQVLEKSIENIKKDKKVEVYELLQKYKWEIWKYEKNSDIVKYMNHLEGISKKYWIIFSGFSIANWEIKTEIVVRKLNLKGNSQAYERVVKFIKDYREDSESLLNLNFINSFDWMDEIKFLVNFKVKN